MEERAAAAIGSLEPWEKELLCGRSSVDFGYTCFNIANSIQSSIPRTIKWLKLSAEEGYEEGVLAYAGLTHGLNPGPPPPFKRDETSLWVSLLRDGELLRKVGSFDSDGVRARRHLTQTLLLGALSKNQDSVLHRGFFGSGLREVHLLPLITKYIVGKRGREEVKEEDRKECVVSSLVDISSIIFSSSSSSITSLTIQMKYENQFLCFLPLLFSLSPNLMTFRLSRASMKVDLSFLQKVDTSKLEILHIINCSHDSLSPLSLCDLSSLRTFGIIYFPKGEGLDPLNGLSSNVTKSLARLSLSECNIEDLSPLSFCDLSSVEVLDLYGNRSLSDLSPLRGSDLSSLTLFQPQIYQHI